MVRPKHAQAHTYNEMRDCCVFRWGNDSLLPQSNPSLGHLDGSGKAREGKTWTVAEGWSQDVVQQVFLFFFLTKKERQGVKSKEYLSVGSPWGRPHLHYTMCSFRLFLSVINFIKFKKKFIKGQLCFNEVIDHLNKIKVQIMCDGLLLSSC